MSRNKLNPVMWSEPDLSVGNSRGERGERRPRLTLLPLAVSGLKMTPSLGCGEYFASLENRGKKGLGK
jgi:hypothetical protein